MPWRTKGDYYSFKEDAIKQHAPTVSGVYGLFNFRHQILIDSAANIRVALLHHLTNTNFRFSRFEPTGFTFESCAPETREMRTDLGIWFGRQTERRHRPRNVGAIIEESPHASVSSSVKDGKKTGEQRDSADRRQIAQR